jgi:alpha-tubulin suppressor-like RCC1 family protein
MDFPVGQRTARDHRRGWLAVLAATAAAILVPLAIAGTAAAATGADAWGDNEFGQLCNGKNIGIQTLPGPVLTAPLTELLEVKQVAAGGQFGLYLMNNGTVKACGFNSAGQLGNGTTVSSTTPVEVKGLTKVKAISAGETFGLALLENGKVVGWGENEFGQLGNGAKGEGVHSTEPTEIKGFSETEKVKAISAGGLSSYALMENGTVKSWGFNEFGQLGNNSTTSAAEPVPVSGLTGVKAISGGFEFGLALLNSGEVKAWGNEEFGQLGNGVSGEKKQSNVPVAVNLPAGNKAEQISGGGFHAVALLEGTEKKVKAWGDNDMGQVGHNTTNSIESTPVAVLTEGGKELTGVKAVAAGDVTSYAVLTGGTADCWGGNEMGECGIGNHTTNPHEAVPVQELGEVQEISGGSLWASSMGAPDPLVTNIEPKTGPEAGGTTVTINGTELTGATNVRFGTEKAKEFKVNAETTEKPASITAVSPAGSGSVDVTVNTPASKSPTEKVDLFNYRLASLKPHEWKANGVKVSKTHVQIASWGSLKYENNISLVGKLTCTAVMGGGVWNEGTGTEITGFGNVEGFNTSGCSKEPGCPGAFVTAEPPVQVATETKGTEKVIVPRRPPTTLPWTGEVIEGLNAEKSIALKVKLSPVQMNIVEPCEKFEVPMEGTLEPILTNGSRNGLKPSHLTFEGKGGTTGSLIVPQFFTEREVFVSGEMKILGSGNQQLVVAE